MRKTVLISLVLGLTIVAWAGGLPGASAQTTPSTGVGASGGLWGLFVQSFDVFTILLVAGSVAGVAVIASCLIDLREKRIVPAALAGRLDGLSTAGRWEDLEATSASDGSMLGPIISAALESRGRGATSVRDAAELASAEAAARYFRRVEILNVIGNLGPLVGLAGTVWGMILAFTSLGETGGQAGPAQLSLGISKALFHTLLGLCLAIPCLLAYGMLRGRVDRICTRGTIVASKIVERIVSQEDKG